MDGGAMDFPLVGEIREKEKLKQSPTVAKGVATPSPKSWAFGEYLTTRQKRRQSAVAGSGKGKENVASASVRKQIFPTDSSGAAAGQTAESPRLKRKRSFASNTVNTTQPVSTASRQKSVQAPHGVVEVPASSPHGQQQGRRRRKVGSRSASSSSNSSSAGDGQTLRTMWDSVVAMMKTAVDSILFDDDADAENEGAFQSPAKRRCPAESGMPLRAADRTQQPLRRTQSNTRTQNIEPSKIKEAKNLDPDARKTRRRVTRKQSMFSRSSQVAPPDQSAAASTGGQMTGATSPVATAQELSVFTFRRSPLSTKVASAFGSPRSSGRQHSAPTRQCPVPLKHIPARSTRASDGGRLRTPVHLCAPSPLCSPLFREEPTSLRRTEADQTPGDGNCVNRHSEALNRSFRSSSRPSSRNGAVRVSRSRSARNVSSRIDVPSRSPTPVGIDIDPLLKMKVPSTAMPVRTATRPKQCTEAKHSVPKLNAVDESRDADISASSSNDSTGAGLAAVPPPPAPPLPPPLPTETTVSNTESTTSGPPPPPPPVPKVLTKADAPRVVQQSRADRVLSGMQERLRNRMRQAVESAKSVTDKSTKNEKAEIDPKITQWAAIQSKYRKITMEEFLALAETQRTVALQQIQALSMRLPSEMNEIIQCVESLAAATCWWPGGIKEMKETIPEWKVLEPKLDTMEEYIKVTHSMSEVTAMPDAPQAEFHLEVSRLRDLFLKWHRHWSGTLLSSARSWKALSLPVDGSLLNQARCYLAELMLQMSHRVSEETAQLHGKSITRSHRQAKQLTSMLQECIEYLIMSLELVKEPAFPHGNGQDTTVYDDECERISSLFAATKSAGILCTQRYVEMANAQYLAVVHTHPKQEVTAHFDGVLKTLGLLKNLARKSQDSSLPWRALAQKGVLQHFSGTADVSEAIYRSCASVLQHIMKVTRVTGASNDNGSNGSSAASSSAETTPREMVLWLMFGCKYLNRSLEMLGDDGHSNMKELLDSLQRIEDSLSGQ
eukprot:scpid21154/ scgid2344/ 